MEKKATADELNDLSNNFQSFFEKILKTSVLENPPFNDHAPITRFIKKRREEKDVNESMMRYKEDFNNIVRAQRVQNEELQQREILKRQCLLNFETFFKENELKRTRALNKAARERGLTCQKAKDLRILKEELKALKKKRDEMDALVEVYTPFPQFLDQVIKISEQFEEPWQVMSRVDTLVQTHEDLFTTNQQKQACADMTKNQFSTFLDQSNDKLMISKNKLAKLQTDLDQARSNVALWESRLAHIQNTAAKKTLILGSIKMATLNLYQLTMANQKEEAVELEDTLYQLEKIQTYLWNLKSVWEDLEKL